jgi:nitrous oxidase accessory protein NosD
MQVIGILLAMASIAATPATLPDRLAAARPGDTLKLSPGDYGLLTIKDQHFDPAIVIEGGRFTNIVLGSASGITFRNTQVNGNGSTGFLVRQSAKIRIEAADVSEAHRGIVIDRTSDFAVIDSVFHGLGSDGIDIAQSWRGLISGNKMSDFNPIRPVYDETTGKLVKDGDHPDGIQAWSRPNLAATSDIKVLHNNISGQVQCIFFGNHVRPQNGVPTDDGGFDRIEVRGNLCRNAMPRGITLGSARNSVVEGNDASALPGARMQRSGNAIRSQVSINGEGSRACGNIVGDIPRSPAAQPCSAY